MDEARAREVAGRKAVAIARSMSKDARLCVLNWGDRKTPVPDSVWFGRYSGLKRHVAGSATAFQLSPLGQLVRQILQQEERG